jgi:hypothetical protein
MLKPSSHTQLGAAAGIGCKLDNYYYYPSKPTKLNMLHTITKKQTKNNRSKMHNKFFIPGLKRTTLVVSLILVKIN